MEWLGNIFHECNLLNLVLSSMTVVQLSIIKIIIFYKTKKSASLHYFDKYSMHIDDDIIPYLCSIKHSSK